MVVQVLVGDLFQSRCQTWVNTVNCVGVMGKGVALEFRRQFPDMYRDYLDRVDRGEVRLGRPYLYKRLVPPWILNFPTKQHWRSLSQLTDLVEGLNYLEAHYREWGISSLAVPPLGCGQGQLEWTAVGPTLYQRLNRLEVPVELYAPLGTPSDELTRDFLDGRASRLPAASSLPERAALAPGLIGVVEALSRIEAEPHHWPVGRTMFQKIAYFATAEGLPTGLTFQRGSFGPFAADLKAKVTKLLNNGLICEAQRGQMFQVRVGPTYRDARKRFLDQIAGSQETIDRVADLFLRMDTRQAEVAATVHYAARDLAQRFGRKPSELEVLDAVMEWKQRRRPPFQRDSVGKTVRHLASLGWLDVDSSPELAVDEEVELLEA
jgi:uncharacterized protein YwgA/O-acetyl-ADP-ribose deacetylase (regulator of RNase III)